jgi:hypothetical protein
MFDCHITLNLGQHHIKTLIALADKLGYAVSTITYDKDAGSDTLIKTLTNSKKTFDQAMRSINDTVQELNKAGFKIARFQIQQNVFDSQSFTGKTVDRSMLPRPDLRRLPPRPKPATNEIRLQPIPRPAENNIYMQKVNKHLLLAQTRKTRRRATQEGLASIIK